MLNYVEIQIDEKRHSSDLAPLTFITGIGKSTIINFIYNIIKNIGYKIPKFLYKRYRITLRIDDKKYTLEREGGIYRQVIEGGGERVIFEAGAFKGGAVNRIVEPFELAVKDAEVVMPMVEVAEHVSMLADEEIERVNKIVASFREAFSLKAVLLGPYLRPKSYYRASRGRAGLASDGSNLVGVLSALSLENPHAFDRIRGSMRRRGITLAVGLAGKGLLGAVAYLGGGRRLPLSRLPCSLKSALVVSTAISLKPDILLIDNFDYCLTDAAAESIAPYVSEFVNRGQIIAEIHRPEVADYFKTQYKSIVSLSL